MHAPHRRKLSETRTGVTHKFKVGATGGYLTVNCFEDGQPGEIFITISREGSTLGGLLDALALQTSLALQHGVPLELMVKHLAYQKFEPSGHSASKEVGYAHSVVDYVFRWIGNKYIKDFKAPDETSLTT